MDERMSYIFSDDAIDEYVPDVHVPEVRVPEVHIPDVHVPEDHLPKTDIPAFQPKLKGRLDVRYVVGDPPRTSSEAYDALLNVFGSEEFDASEAEEVLKEMLDMEASEARRELARMLRNRSVEEA